MDGDHPIVPLRKEAITIICRLVNLCWFAFKWSIITMLLTVVVVGGYLYWRLDDELRRYAENLLADHYTQLDVKLGAARFEAGRGVMLQNLTLSQRGADGRLQVLAEVDEMQLLGAFDMEALSSGEPIVERIRMRTPRLHAVRQKNGSWNVEQLFPPPATSEHPPIVEVVGALVTIDDGGMEGKPLLLRDVNLSAKCVAQSPAASDDAPTLRTYQLEGSVGGELADVFNFAGTVRTGSPEFDFKTTITGLDLSSSTMTKLLGRVPQLVPVSEVAGRLDTIIQVSRGPQGPPTWKADFAAKGCRVALTGVHRPLTAVSAKGTASSGQLQIHEAHANFGKSRISLALTRNGWTSSAPLALRARAEDLAIDDTLAEMLPPKAVEAWDRFQPAGHADVEVALQFIDSRWIPNATLTCRHASFTDRKKFDYRVTDGAGTLKLVDAQDGSGPIFVIESLTGRVEGTPISIEGRFSGLPGLGECRRLGGEPLPPVGWLKVHGERLPIADAVVDAIEPEEGKVRRIVDALDAKGRVTLDWKFERTDPFNEPRTTTDLTFHDARLRFDEFPYPLSHIEGTATERDGNWRFDNLVSSTPGTTRVVRAGGTCNKTAAGHQLQLTIVGEHLPLDDTLRLALPEVHQAAWEKIRPRSGRVNFRADIGHHIGVDTRPDVRLAIVPLPGSQSIEPVSIEPTSFPYHLKNLTGRIDVVGNQVTFNGIQAEHGQTHIETDGIWVPNPLGGWRLEFSNLHVDRLETDFDLKEAAPTEVKRIISYMNPAGTFNIHNGTVRFSQQAAGSTNLQSDWNISIGCQQNNLEVGVPLKSVSGIVHLTGQHNGNLRFTAGRLELDSVFWNGMQLTNVRGPLWIDSQECRLGQGAYEQIVKSQIPISKDVTKSIESDLYGGRLALDAIVPLEAPSRYRLALGINKCDLARVSTDYFGGSVDLTGTLTGQMTLGGMGHSLDLLSGNGRIQVRDAQMYELPVMARMLKVLRNRVPDKTAFTGVDAQFKLDGSTIHFNEFNLLGDALSLYGAGDVTLDRQLNLKFYSTVGRNDLHVPLLKSMIGQASANLLLIKVTGPIENARVDREALPAVNEFMEQLGGEGVATPRPTRGFWNR